MEKKNAEAEVFDHYFRRNNVPYSWMPLLGFVVNELQRHNTGFPEGFSTGNLYIVGRTGGKVFD
jgi:hypothetical protein